MKKLFGLVALLALSFILPARAETVSILALNANATIKSGVKVNTYMRNSLSPVLEEKDVDFAFFVELKSSGYFDWQPEGYSLEKAGLKQTEAYALLYKNTYTLKKNYGLASGVVCFVLEDDKGTVYGLVFDKGAGPSTIKAAVDTCKADYQTAKIFVTYVQGDVKNESTMKTYLTGTLGMSPVMDGQGLGGGIYTISDATVTKVDGSLHAFMVTETDENAYKAILGSVTYASAVNVTFKDSLSDAATIVPTVVGETAVPPEPWNHEDIGYDFIRWNGNYEQVTEDCEVLSVYAKKTFVVRFVTVEDEGSTTNEVKRETVEWGASATAPDDPAREGFKFLGWDPADFSSVKSDLTVVAQFEALSNIFKVRFLDSDGTTILKEEEVVGGEAATAPADPTPHEEGDIFYGWDPADFSCVEADTDIVAVFGPAVREAATVEDFVAAMANLPASATVKLAEDLDFSEVKDYVSPTLVGTLDGNGHTVSGLSGNVALVNVVRGGTIRNLKVANFARACTDHDQEGGLVANRIEGGVVENVEISDSTFTAKKGNCNLASIAYVVTSNGVGDVSVISNCVVRNCRLSAVSRCGLGGVVGYLGGGSEVVDCRFLADDKDTAALGGNVSFAGGIAMGVTGGRVRGCFAEGLITVSGDGDSGGNTGAGGIVGVSSSNGKTSWIEACTNMADVVVRSQAHAAGGIMGRVMKATIRVCGCVNYGSVKVLGDEDDQMGSGCAVGGIVGGGWGTSPSVNIYVSDSKNLGAVSSEDVRPSGGIVGSAVGVDGGIAYLRLTNCVNVAAVASQGGFVGGLVGYARHVPSDVLSVINCGNAGSVASQTNVVGGVFGKIIGQAQNNTKTFVYNGIANVMNCGELSTDSGVVGQFVGYFEAEPYGDTYQNIHRIDASNFFCLDHADTELAGVVIGKEGTGVTVDETSATNLAASAFTDRKVVKKLNVYAKANDLPLWVQTKDCPDLSLFSKGINFGMVLLIR